MMLRRGGGKRIRLDDPPPEFDNPMTPAETDGDQMEQNDEANQIYRGDISEDMFGDSFGVEPEGATSFDAASSSFQGVSFNSSIASDLSDSPSHPPPPPPPRRRGRKPMDPAARAKKEAAAAASTAPSDTSTDEPVITRRRGRAAAAAAAPPPPPTATTSKKTAAAAAAAEARGEEDEGLYNAILSGKTSLQQLVDDWIDDYKVNRDLTLLRLMQFFVSGSGCKGKITSQMQMTMEHAAIIRKMTEEFDEDSGEYPLVMSGQQWKKFRTNFCDFVQTLVKQCQYSIIYDQYLMDNVISLLTGLSDSQVRAFRHTASLAAMKLMTALVDVALTVSINLDNTQRQYESERQKSTGKRATDRLETLMGKRQELEENMDEIKNVLTYMFKSVFVHRYRDTLPEIRAICMSEIGIWMKKFHQNFLDDSYLKYIGWTLHDKVGEVRLKCLQALQPLYATEELKGKLELFTSKFKDRIVAMTLDKEYDVAVQAVKLVISIHKYHREILTDKDCELVYELVYSSHRAVAQAAGEFLNERLFVLDEGAVENIRTARGKQRQANTPLIRDLVQFFIESELHEHGAYLVDTLIESNPMMKDWECMTDLLLELPGPHEDTLDDRQETSLIEIMVCSVRQCATGEAPIGRGPTRKILSAKELKQVSDDKNRLTEHFIPTLPALLSKYKADSDKVTNLLSLPQFFDLEIYTTSRQEKSLDKLLDLIRQISEQHVETEVLEVAAKSLEVICCDDARKSSRTEVALMNTLESIWEKFVTALAEYDNAAQDGGELNQDEIYGLTMSLRKISVFFGCHSFDKWNVWNKLFNTVRSVQDDTSIQYPEDAVRSCVASCYFALLWDLKSIQEKGEAGVTGMDDVPRLHRKLHDFMDAMKYLVSQTNWPTFKDEAYTSLCDALIVFCEQLGTHTWMETLIYQPDQDLQRLLNQFMQVNVFCEVREDDLDEHAKIELLHKRRNYLAQFCKLIVYNVLPTSAAADVFKYYVRYYNDYGDIIKATLGKAREINKVNCALTMIMSLTNLYNELPKINNWMVDRQHDDFIALKDLAKRFALSFGLDAVKNRDAITALHREGILLAVNPLENPNDPTGPPPNLAFLEILSEFTNKLLKQDKRVVLQYLDHRVGSATPSSHGGHWQPLYAYQNSLMHGESDHPPPTARRAYTRKRAGAAADEGEEGHEEVDEMGDME